MTKNIFAAMFAGGYFSYCEGYSDFEVHKIVYIRDVDPELRLCNYYIEKVWAAPPPAPILGGSQSFFFFF